MKKHSKFTDVNQFRNVIRDIKHAAQFVGMDENNDPIMNREAKMPTVSFHGTVKLHGTCSGVAQDCNGNIWCLGRNHNVTVEKDNAGFAFFAEANRSILRDMLVDIRKKKELCNDETVIIYGEWCGGNIQKGVAINGLDKMFVIFAVKIVSSDNENNYYLHREDWAEYKCPESRIYNINDYKSFDINIDFSNPVEAQNKLVEITEEVEKECPVGKDFGHSGIGEGVVYEAWWNDTRYIFKVKGGKHSSSKVKKTAHVDAEKLNSIKEFVDYAVTENRLEQGIEQVFTTKSEEISRKGTGDFLRWVANDVAKEEMDTMVNNGLEPKDVNGKISDKARNWFFAKLDAEVGL